MKKCRLDPAKNQQKPFCHIIRYKFEWMFLPVKETNSKLLLD